LVPRWDLRDLLADAGKDEPTFTLRMQTKITGVLRDGDTITGVRYRGLDGSGELRADLTVGCDGRTSTVRRAAGLVSHAYPVPFDVAWFRLDCKIEVKYQLTPRISPSLTLLLIPREGYFQARPRPVLPTTPVEPWHPHPTCDTLRYVPYNNVPHMDG
jgi:2-polyprenyl-6-methoxyphenol hydroxylase-like FAD-dependent oxidoreductase